MQYPADVTCIDCGAGTAGAEWHYAGGLAGPIVYRCDTCFWGLLRQQPHVEEVQ